MPDRGESYGADYNDSMLSLRFNFAWQHFDFHAKQRTTMFQFFVTLTPLIVAAYFYFLKERPTSLLPEALIAIALIGASLSIVFGCLDLRNTHLYRISEENMRLIEKHYLYKTPLDGFSGIIATEHSRYGNRCFYRLMKFRFLMKSYVGAFLLFAALACHGACLEAGWLGSVPAIR